MIQMLWVQIPMGAGNFLFLSFHLLNQILQERAPLLMMKRANILNGYLAMLRKVKQAKSTQNRLKNIRLNVVESSI